MIMKTASLLIVFMMSFVCLAAPEPAVVQGPDEWTLNVEFEHLQQITVSLPGDNSPRRFWYTIINVVNKTGSDTVICKKMLKLYV